MIRWSSRPAGVRRYCVRLPREAALRSSTPVRSSRRSRSARSVRDIWGKTALELVEMMNIGEELADDEDVQRSARISAALATCVELFARRNDFAFPRHHLPGAD
jgi:hypothetical protein